MIFIVANTFGSSKIASGEPVKGSVSVVIITIGKLLSVKVCEETPKEDSNTKAKIIWETKVNF
jgi:hypothetical protein